jgi:HSP20 family protein
MGRRFGDFFRGSNAYNLWPFADTETFVPRVEVVEDENSIRVDAELPGIDEKDIDITLTSDTLTIKGEKKEAQDRSSEAVFCTERAYGTFSRVISIPRMVDMDRVEARYRNGVLHISLPKLESHKISRRVEVH